MLFVFITTGPPNHYGDTTRPSAPNHTPTSLQFRPIYLYVYAPIYIRCIVFTCHVCISEYYLFFVMRTLRDDLHRPETDLHRPETRRRRCVELLMFRLSLHRHPSICILCNSLFNLYNKQLLEPRRVLNRRRPYST